MTDRAGDMGNTFRQRRRLAGGANALEGVFGRGRTPAFRCSVAGRRGHDRPVPRARHFTQNRLQIFDRYKEHGPHLEYPFRDRDVLVTACGRICIYRKKINISTVLVGQRLGIKEVDEGNWLVTFIDYDLGYIDLEQRTLQPLDNPFGPRLSPMS